MASAVQLRRMTLTGRVSLLTLVLCLCHQQNGRTQAKAIQTETTPASRATTGSHYRTLAGVASVLYDCHHCGGNRRLVPSLVPSACGLHRVYDISFCVLISLSVPAKIEWLPGAFEWPWADRLMVRTLKGAPAHRDCARSARKKKPATSTLRSSKQPAFTALNFAGSTAAATPL